MKDGYRKIKSIQPNRNLFKNTIFIVSIIVIVVSFWIISNANREASYTDVAYA